MPTGRGKSFSLFFILFFCAGPSSLNKTDRPSKVGPSIVSLLLLLPPVVSVVFCRFDFVFFVFFLLHPSIAVKQINEAVGNIFSDISAKGCH
jgi:hypothetical protein